jgi:hypothetical protein
MTELIYSIDLLGGKEIFWRQIPLRWAYNIL